VCLLRRLYLPDLDQHTPAVMTERKLLSPHLRNLRRIANLMIEVARFHQSKQSTRLRPRSGLHTSVIAARAHNAAPQTAHVDVTHTDRSSRFFELKEVGQTPRILVGPLTRAGLTRVGHNGAVNVLSFWRFVQNHRMQLAGTAICIGCMDFGGEAADSYGRWVRRCLSPMAETALKSDPLRSAATHAISGSIRFFFLAPNRSCDLPIAGLHR